MKGVQFVVDDSGKKKAVIIDLEEWGELWEDIYDILISEQRRGEPSVQWEELKAEALREERQGNDV
jgi:PHD/YefM family antitoxin component YafN of YafNO toxin-antitoxin module